ncbi:hypothetical protein VTO42DRAFT_6150 [Malbranchea cinnamomea]
MVPCPGHAVFAVLIGRSGRGTWKIDLSRFATLSRGDACKSFRTSALWKTVTLTWVLPFRFSHLNASACQDRQKEESWPPVTNCPHGPQPSSQKQGMERISLPQPDIKLKKNLKLLTASPIDQAHFQFCTMSSWC